MPYAFNLAFGEGGSGGTHVVSVHSTIHVLEELKHFEWTIPFDLQVGGT